jgi:DNA-binding beta-propeller fold protein YncE
VALAAVLGGCGSAEENPPPAEPAESPAVAGKPEGNVERLGREAEGVVVDGRTGLAVVASREPDRLDLIDVETGEVVREVGLPGPARHLTLARPGGPVLVPIEYEDLLLRVSLPRGRITSVRTGDFPHDAVEAENGRTFVGDEGGDTITVFEGDGPVGTLDAPEQPGGLATTDGTLAVVAVAAREIAFYDTDTLEQLAVLPAGAGPSHVVAGDDGRFYVADTGGDAILVYEGGSEPRFVDRTNLPGSPYGIAIDDARGRIWVTQTARNRVAELEITELAPKLVADRSTVRQPNSVAVDPSSGTVVVVGRDEGEVQIFQPDEEP